MGSFNIATINSGSSNTTVVGSLRSRISILWSTKWMLIHITQGVLLILPNQGFISLAFSIISKTDLPVVCLHNFVFEIVGLTQNHKIISSRERVRIHFHLSQVHIRVGSIRLVSGTSRQILHLRRLRVQTHLVHKLSEKYNLK